MNRRVLTVIDAERCTGCGLCVRVCPSDTLVMRNGKAVVAGSRSLACGHCVAVCPTGAVSLAGMENFLDFSTFHTDDRWMAPGECNIAELARLMCSRRSCRNYTSRIVDPALLEDLVRFGVTAPSGTNSQCWTFTILARREQVVAFGNRIADYFRRLNRIASISLFRCFPKIIGMDALDRYYRDYFRTVEDALRVWDQEGIDRLFHGATAAIIIGSGEGASCPKEDSLLASQNIQLAAHAMGLGSCFIGFAVTAMQRDPSIKRKVAIPAKEQVHAVIGLGYPDEIYQRPTTRRRPLIRFPQPEKDTL